MTAKVKTALPNSLAVVTSSKRAEIPHGMDETALAATPSSVAIGCRFPMDGETEVILGRASEVDPGTKPAFDSVLETPNKIIAVWTVEWKQLLKTTVPSAHTRIRVWRNRSQEPDKIAIGWG